MVAESKYLEVFLLLSFFLRARAHPFGAVGSTHVAYNKARRSEVCPGIEGERAKFRDADSSCKTLRRRKPSDILPVGQYRSAGGVLQLQLSLAQQKVSGREIDTGSKITSQVWKASLGLRGA
jgi:hypothetical protein